MINGIQGLTRWSDVLRALPQGASPGTGHEASAARARAGAFRRAHNLYQAQAAARETVQATSPMAGDAAGQGSAVRERERGFRLGPLGIYFSTETDADQTEAIIDAAVELLRTEQEHRFSDAMDVAGSHELLTAARGAAPMQAQAATRSRALQSYDNMVNMQSFQIPGQMISRSA